MSIEVGSEAPDFTLLDENRDEVTLSELRGQTVVLVFYPFAFSGICTKEFHEINSLKDKFDASNAVVYGISVDNNPAQKAFRTYEKIEAHLLSDFEPKGEVARKYGVYVDEVGASNRGTFVIDKNGKVAYKVVNEIGDPRDQRELIEALASCPV